MAVTLPEIIEGAAFVLEAFAAGILLAATLLAVASLVRREAAGAVRDRFVDRLLLALDVTIGADVLKIAAAPSFVDVRLTAVVVLVRAGLTLLVLVEERFARPTPAS